MSTSLPIFAGPAAGHALGHALAVAVELERADIQLQLVTPPDQLEAARAEVERRAAECDARGFPRMGAYRSLVRDIGQGQWRP